MLPTGSGAPGCVFVAGTSWGRLAGEGQGEQGQERRGQQPGLERLQLRGLVVVDESLGRRLVQPRVLGRGPDLVGGHEVDPGPGGHADLLGDGAADPLVVRRCWRRTRW